MFRWEKVASAIAITCAAFFAVIYIICIVNTDVNYTLWRLWLSIMSFLAGELLLLILTASLLKPKLVSWFDYIDGFRWDLTEVAVALVILSIVLTKSREFWANL